MPTTWDCTRLAPSWHLILLCSQIVTNSSSPLRALSSHLASQVCFPSCETGGNGVAECLALAVFSEFTLPLISNKDFAGSLFPGSRPVEGEGRKAQPGSPTPAQERGATTRTVFPRDARAQTAHMEQKLWTQSPGGCAALGSPEEKPNEGNPSHYLEADLTLKPRKTLQTPQRSL
jgi:hypothetical protein